ncbi:thiamine pyrophosphate-binding protein [Bradyrhizobium oligotrophicum]|uniref:thiamine pyrophosphate-binding protein n=1 Tax=Bradyrhizobium oligotrophicum TaxID=44255 RepID=UPI003EBA6935
MKNRTTGRSAFLALLKDEGITHLFGNPGTTELPVMHALKDHPDLTYVMAMQESLVVAIADGFSRASGRLVACNVHVAPGLGNAMGSLYNAQFTGTPMILTAGQQEQGHGLMEPLLYGPLVRMAEPLVKWAVEVTRLEDLPRIVRRAAKVATTPPTGPVFISLPGDILNAEAGIELGRSTRVDARVLPATDALQGLARRILRAQRPVIITGDEIVKSDALQAAAELASAIGAPVHQQSAPYGAHFLSEHPCYIGSLSRAQKQVRDLLAPHDLLIVLGADPLRMSVHSEIEPLPEGLPIVQIGLVDWELGKNFGAEIALKADVRETLLQLTPLLREVGGSSLQATAQARIAELSSKNWSARRRTLTAQIETARDKTPIDPDYLALQVAQAMPEHGILVDEGLTSARYMTALWPYRDRYNYHGLASGGIGWGLPASVGVSLANPDRPVVCYSGDGSAMYSIQALWTAAHHKLPLSVVIVNNGGYRIIKQRLLSFHGDDNYIGMDFVDPPVDFAGLARSLGCESLRVGDPSELKSVLSEAFRRPGTKLIEVMVSNAVN